MRTATGGKSRLIHLIRTVRQARQYKPDAVPAEVIDELLEVARWTGSAVNRQPWEFVVVRDRERLRALAAAYPNAGHIGAAAAAIVIVMNGKRAGEGFDEGRLAERILLAARARGLGAGIGWLGNDGAAPDAKSILGIPGERFVRTAISLGYPAEEGTPSKAGPGRKPLSELVHWERYAETEED